VNPKDYVPTLVLDDGQAVTEVGVICQYPADQKPESGLVDEHPESRREQMAEHQGVHGALSGRRSKRR
jgi:glutathione S-transferase